MSPRLQFVLGLFVWIAILSAITPAFIIPPMPEGMLRVIEATKMAVTSAVTAFLEQLQVSSYAVPLLDLSLIFAQEYIYSIPFHTTVTKLGSMLWALPLQVWQTTATIVSAVAYFIHVVSLSEQFMETFIDPVQARYLTLLIYATVVISTLFISYVVLHVCRFLVLTTVAGLTSFLRLLIPKFRTNEPYRSSTSTAAKPVQK